MRTAENSRTNKEDCILVDQVDAITKLSPAADAVKISFLLHTLSSTIEMMQCSPDPTLDREHRTSQKVVLECTKK